VGKCATGFAEISTEILLALAHSVNPLRHYVKMSVGIKPSHAII